VFENGHVTKSAFDQARLRLVPLLITIMAVVSAAYGWCLEKKVNIAGPLVLQFVSEYWSLNLNDKVSPSPPFLSSCVGIVGYLSISVMNATSTLMIDLVPDQSSSVTACVRNLYFFPVFQSGIKHLTE
jgi:hypothetical protein